MSRLWAFRRFGKQAVVVACTVSTAVGVLSACSSRGRGDLAGSESVDTALAVPASSLSDWKSYGDAIASFAVVSEQEDSHTGGPPEDEGGLITRTITMKVERTFWANLIGKQLPPTFSTEAYGWIDENGKRTPVSPGGEPRLEVGHTYLAAVSRFGETWGPLPGGGTVPFDDQKVGSGEWLNRPDSIDATNMQAISTLLGDSPGQVQVAVDAAKPNPIARQYQSLPAAERWEKVTQSERSASATASGSN